MLNVEDYQEPNCPFDTSQWQKKAPVRSIPMGRVIGKLDEAYNNNDYRGAIRLANYWIEEAKAGRDLSGEFALRNELMGIYRKISEKDNALKNAHKALELVESMGLKGRISEGTTLVNVGTVYRAFDMPEESYKYFEQAVPIYETALQPGDWRLGGLYNNMAVTLSGLGRQDEAIDLYERAIAAMELVDGAEGEQAVSWLNLADAYVLKYGHEQAEEKVFDCCVKAIELMDTEGLSSDVNYAFYCEKCAPVLKYYGFFEAGEELANRAKTIYETR